MKTVGPAQGGQKGPFAHQSWPNPRIRAQSGKMKRLTFRGARGPSFPRELPSKPIVPKDKKPKKVEETCE